MAGDPTNVGTGNQYEEEVVYRSTGLDPLVLTLYYNRAGTTSGRWGKNWRSGYDRNLVPSPASAPTTVVATRPNGKQLVYTLQAGTWQGDTDTVDRLQSIKDGSGQIQGWVYITGDDATEVYSASGALSSIATRSGATQSLTYDTNNRLAQVSNAAERTLQFSYDSSNRVQSITDPSGHAIGVTYDSGNLASISYEDLTTRQFLYEDGRFANALTGIKDELGNRFATFSYDSQARATSSTRAGGVEGIAVTYNADGTSSVTDALGTTRTYGFSTVLGVVKRASLSQPCSNCGSGGANTTYDANGNIGSKTDFNGNITHYTYDLTRNLETSRTEAYGTALARTITTQWHATYRLPTQIDEPGRRTTYTYDGNGNRLTQTILDTATNESRTTTWTYNSLGQVLTIDGPRPNADVSDVTTYTYDNHGNVATITNALSQVTQITSYDAHGNPLHIIDPNIVVTDLTYDLRQHLKTRTVAGATTTFDYDNVGQLTKVTLPDDSLPDLSHISYTYDAAHRLSDITDSAGDKIHYTLDLLGNRTKEEVFDPSNDLKRAQSRVFDTLGRLQQIKNAAGNLVAEYGYDAQGNRTSQTDYSDASTSFTTNYTPDALNRIKQVTDAASGVTGYGFNALDQLTSVTDPKTLTSSYTLNALGDVKQQVSPDTGTTSYTYDAAGNRKSQTDARGVTVNYTYDALNRLTSVDYPGTAEDVTYSYDSTSQSYGKGRLTGITDESGTTTLTYDARGNVLQEQRIKGSATYTTNYTYDSADRLTSITYPSGRTVSYEHNSLGQISKVTTTVGSTTTKLADDISYMPFGGIKSYTLGNGVVVTRTHDQDYHLSEIKDQGTSTVSDVEFHYDLRGDVTFTKVPGTTPHLQDFGYDSLSRLTSASGTYGAQTYAYDAVGNRTSLNSTDTYTYPTDSHRLTSTSSESFGYDASGNATATGSLALSYNNAARMSRATVGSTTVDNVYTASGHRIQKTADGVTTVYHYDRAGHLIAEQPDSGLFVQREYVWLGDMPLAVASERVIPDYFVDNSNSGFSTTGAWTTASATGQYGSNYAKRDPAAELPGGQIVDDTDSGASHAGIWAPGVNCGTTCPSLLNSIVSSEAPYGNTFTRSVASSPGSNASPTFSWSFSLSPGRYRVYVRWVPITGSGNVTYTLTSASGSQNYAINQAISSLGWYSLGSHEFGTSAAVTLTPNPGVTAVADAVELVPIENTDNDVAKWAASGESGTYDVYARWPSVAGASTAAPFSIVDTSGTTSAAQNQTSNTAQWNSLGRFTFDNPTTQGVKLGSMWDSTVLADAIHLVPVPADSHRTNVAYFHVDQLNAPQKLTDAGQSVVWDASYEPFGKAQVTKQPYYDNLLRAPGQYFDAETGLHQNWNRDYDPSIGRYLQSDPIGLRSGLNTYGYAYQDPLLWIDPLGLDPNKACVAACTAAGAVAGGAVGYYGGGTLGAVAGGAGGTLVAPGAGTVGGAAAGATAGSAEGGALGAAAGAAVGAAAGQAACPEEKNECDMELIGKRPSYDGKTYTCMYKSKGQIFTFPQAVGYECPPVDKKRCLVDTSYIMPPARY